MLGHISPTTNFPPTHNSPYFYCIPPKNIIDKFLQTGLISSMRFEEKLGHTNFNPA